MKDQRTDKQKFFNDPVYGLIDIPTDLAFRLIGHPWFQRLRRIRQLGLTNLIYPGAIHTRFQHSIGAMHLMSQAIHSLRSKGHDISDTEAESAQAAILLHDMGHGPFSHALEHTIVTEIGHEEISLLYMQHLDKFFGGALKPAISIFRDSYAKRFFHQLIAGQLDMDRLDYLNRDSFFCGVAEGIVNSDRLIKTMNIVNDDLVIDAKGIYSVEKFIIARRLMYWQVYLHKTVISAESLLIRILRRAKYLTANGIRLFATPALDFFLTHNPDRNAFLNDQIVIEQFSKLDDFDIFASIKAWVDADDNILSELSRSLINRQLHRIEMQNQPFSEAYVKRIRNEVRKKFRIPETDIDYFVFTDTTSSYSYDLLDTRINILLKSGQILDFAEASEEFNVTVLTEPVTKYILGYPKKIDVVNN